MRDPAHSFFILENQKHSCLFFFLYPQERFPSSRSTHLSCSHLAASWKILPKWDLNSPIFITEQLTEAQGSLPLTLEKPRIHAYTSFLPAAVAPSLSSAVCTSRSSSFLCFRSWLARVTHVLKPCSGVATALAGEKLTFAKRRRQASHLDLAQSFAGGEFHNSRHCKGQGAATLKLNTNTSLHVLSGDMYFSLDKRLYLSSRIQPLKGKTLGCPMQYSPSCKRNPSPFFSGGN